MCYVCGGGDHEPLSTTGAAPRGPTRDLRGGVSGVLLAGYLAGAEGETDRRARERRVAGVDEVDRRSSDA
eukprot:2682664-Heterocapsa_arctica.AAC.1